MSGCAHIIMLCLSASIWQSVVLAVVPVSRSLTICSGCRRVVQVHLSTSDVDIEMSQYIKRELHSLHKYLLTSFTSQDIAAFSKHFAKVAHLSSFLRLGRGSLYVTI